MFCRLPANVYLFILLGLSSFQAHADFSYNFANVVAADNLYPSYLPISGGFDYNPATHTLSNISYEFDNSPPNFYLGTLSFIESNPSNGGSFTFSVQTEPVLKEILTETATFVFSGDLQDGGTLTLSALDSYLTINTQVPGSNSSRNYTLSGTMVDGVSVPLPGSGLLFACGSILLAVGGRKRVF